MVGMATSTSTKDYLGRPLQNDEPGVTDPALDYLGREVQADDAEYLGRDLVT